MRKITARIVRFFIESKVIDESDQEIYEYGLEILIENVMLTVFLLLSGVMIGKGIETCIFLFSFCWLRRFCGGYHANTKRGCHIATFITYIAFLLGIVAFYKVVNKYMYVIYFVCLLIVTVYAPVQHKNKVLTECTPSIWLNSDKISPCALRFFKSSMTITIMSEPLSALSLFFSMEEISYPHSLIWS